MNMQEIKTGAIVTKLEPRLDYILGAASPFDWEKGYKVPLYPKAKDQLVSSACGGYSTSVYKEVSDFVQTQKQTVKSPKFIYSQCFAPGGGSSIYALGNLLKTTGACSEETCPSDPATEANLTHREDITAEMMNEAAKDKISAYAQIREPNNIEEVAKAIRDNYGCIIGISGKNNGTWRSENPIPPEAGATDKFHHWVYGCEAGIYKGQKAIRFLNSWGENCGDNGYQWITEEYFKSGNIFCVWVITEKENVIVPEFKYHWTKAFGIGSSGNNVKALQKALKLEGFFPEKQTCTGFFGSVTLKAVEDFQTKYLGYCTGYVGNKTLKILNEKYNT